MQETKAVTKTLQEQVTAGFTAVHDEIKNVREEMRRTLMGQAPQRAPAQRVCLGVVKKVFSGPLLHVTLTPALLHCIWQWLWYSDSRSYQSR
jgi:hypothetical protein